MPGLHTAFKVQYACAIYGASDKMSNIICSLISADQWLISSYLQAVYYMFILFILDQEKNMKARARDQRHIK